jgi:hypothetical protein
MGRSTLTAVRGCVGANAHLVITNFAELWPDWSAEMHRSFGGRDAPQDDRAARNGTALSHSAQLIHRPVAEYGLAIDKALIDRAEIAAVVRHRAMIAKDEI